MKLSPQWLRDFVEIKADNARLAEDLTLAGIAVEKLDGAGAATVFEMDITTNRPDAMNHYGAAREASAIYDLPLKPLAPKLPAARPAPPFSIEIEEPERNPTDQHPADRHLRVRHLSVRHRSVRHRSVRHRSVRHRSVRHR